MDSTSLGKTKEHFTILQPHSQVKIVLNHVISTHPITLGWIILDEMKLNLILQRFKISNVDFYSQRLMEWSTIEG